MRQVDSNSVVHLELHTGDLRGRWTSTRGSSAGRPSGSRRGPARTWRWGWVSGSAAAWSSVPRSGRSLPYVEVRDVSMTADRACGLGGHVLLSPREGPEAGAASFRRLMAARSPSGSPRAAAEPPAHEGAAAHRARGRLAVGEGRHSGGPSLGTRRQPKPRRSAPSAPPSRSCPSARLPCRSRTGRSRSSRPRPSCRWRAFP